MKTGLTQLASEFVHLTPIDRPSLNLGSSASIGDLKPRPHSSRLSLSVGNPCELRKTVFNPPCDMPKLSPSQSAEDYLERIHELIEQKGYARVVDIASSLKVKQASVTSMVQKLAEAGYLQYEKYRGLVMTDKGREIARKIQNRHITLSRFFSLFGLDAETQRQDIEGIEHHLSPATVEVLADLAQFFEKNPETLRSFQRTRNGPRRKNGAAHD